MEHLYPHIFSPLTVGGFTFKNRILAAPAAPQRLQTRDPYPSERVIAYYREKARGGSAAVCCSGVALETHGPEALFPQNLHVENRLHTTKWVELTSQVHFFDARISLELLSFELYGLDEHGTRVKYSPSGEHDALTGEWMPAIPPEEMDRVAEEYAFAAESALQVGFDGILIHGGHGLFLHRMMSPLFNRRTDEYGGGMANRARFALEILDRIRGRVGRRLYIEYRVSGSELLEGGFEVADCVEFLRQIEDRIDMAHISAGIYYGQHGSPHMSLPSMFVEPGHNAYLAAEVKRSGIAVPVVTVGAFQDPGLIEETLASGGADFVAMARGTIADPELPHKALAHGEADIIPCIKCFNCLDYRSHMEFGCSVNPTVGRELSLPSLIVPAERSLKVAVIGGGPAGMEAAVVAARRGHRVTLFERGAELGGKLVFSRQVPFKYDLARFLDFLIRTVGKEPIDVRLNTTATPDLVASLQPDVIMAAVGSHPIVPPIPGIELALPVEAHYADPTALASGSVVIIGGGQVGCETAIHLAMGGRKVSLVEMLPEFASDDSWVPRAAIVEKMDRHVDYRTNARCTRVTPQGIIYRDADGNEHFLGADNVILAAGVRPASQEAEMFRDLAPVFRRIGDCLCAGAVQNATRTAFDAASC